MNRKKKIFQILKKRVKRANAKQAPKSTKPRYVSKAERANTSDAPTDSVENATDPR